jgi:hypothetical protein
VTLSGGDSFCHPLIVCTPEHGGTGLADMSEAIPGEEHEIFLGTHVALSIRETQQSSCPSARCSNGHSVGK